MTHTILDTAMKDKNESIQSTFLSEWTADQFKAMRRAICLHFSGKEIKTHHGNHKPLNRSFEALGEIMGFAYTSTGIYAGYWVCNTAVYSAKYEGYQYTGFALTADLKPYAVLWDAEENEILQPI